MRAYTRAASDAEQSTGRARFGFTIRGVSSERALVSPKRIIRAPLPTPANHRSREIWFHHQGCFIGARLGLTQKDYTRATSIRRLTEPAAHAGLRAATRYDGWAGGGGGAAKSASVATFSSYRVAQVRLRKPRRTGGGGGARRACIKLRLVVIAQRERLRQRRGVNEL